MKDRYVFLFTDIEADGPVPGLHSMLSFASVARGENGEELGEFEANLLPLPGATQYPPTMQWWATQPEAWAYSTKNPEDPQIVIPRYVSWLQNLGGQPVLAAHPIDFDGMWIKWYLYRFTGQRVLDGPGLDLASYISGKTGKRFYDCHRETWPKDWLGGHEHDHTAISDARGYEHAYFTAKKLVLFGSYSYSL